MAVFSGARNAIITFSYKRILKPLLFARDPEIVHDRFISTGFRLGKYSFLRQFTGCTFSYKNGMLSQEIFGKKYENPVGLAAGFDKEAMLINILPYVGFGFEEAGSITGVPCKGNEKPRLWRLKKSGSLQVYYGLKNEGSVKIAERIKKSRRRIPLWASIAKANSSETVETQKGIEDYKMAYKNLKNIADAIVINISCPNAFGGQPFTSREKLQKLFEALEISRSNKPILIKLSPDLNEEELDGIIEESQKHNVSGYICTNLSKKHERIKKILKDDIPGKGGISGKPINELSNEMIRRVYQKTKGKSLIVGVGGIFSAEDAYAKIKAGCSLVEMITGMVYEGPSVISSINMGLVRLLKKDGYKSISEAIGADYKK